MVYCSKKEWKRIFGFHEFSNGFHFIRSVLAESLGVFLIVLLGCGTQLSLATQPSIIQISASFGLALVGAMSITKQSSGGHLNPAITIGSCFLGRIGIIKALFYIGFQCSGAIGAAYFLSLVTPRVHQSDLGMNNLYAGVVHPDCDPNGDQDCVIGDVSFSQGFAVEMITTFFYSLVYYSVKKIDGNYLGSMVTGLTVMACHLFAIPYTGCGMNPARTLGPALATGILDNQLLFWTAPISGSILATFVYALFLFPNKENWYKFGEYNVNSVPSHTPHHQDAQEMSNLNQSKFRP